MRKHDVKQIIGVFEALKEAQDNGQYAESQEGVEALIDFIEQMAGENTETVNLLGEHYELLYKAAMGELGDKSNKTNKFLAKHLMKIARCARDELKPTRLEVAFISHIASMSDSLESIYLAAKEDPDCDAFWIPVPYYTLDAKGQRETLHFEGAEHYPGIDITSWEKYDMESRHPDVVYTFNLYDDINKVTCIHPDYFSEHLHKSSDLLVYVHYAANLAGAGARICKMPICVTADKIVLHTEEMRNVCIQNYNEDSFLRSIGRAEDKFVALGSPKYDKLFNAKREDCILTDEWKNIIGDKKVLLYVSSIGSALRSSNFYIEKLRYMLDLVKKRDDIVLWWRPHPLLKTTFESMLPRLLQPYNDIVAQYQKQAWGVFDDSSDLHRALVMGDACYGDWSSTLTLFHSMGKPILLADTNNDVIMSLDIDLGDLRYENDVSLSEFIEFMKSGGKSFRSIVRPINNDGTAGKVIYEHMKNIVMG